MRQDVKDLADAMERGWKLVPKNCYWFFNDDLTVSDLPVKEVTSACAMGHALLGFHTTKVGRLFELFPILDKQYVKGYAFPHKQTLESAINELMDEHNWSTRDVIAWLRSHQKD